MAKFILKSRYHKSHKSFNKFVKYIATREGVEKLPVGKDMKPSTSKQQDLIRSIVNRFPETKEYPEYAMYELKNTRASATEFIDTVVENDFEEAESLQGLMTYIAQRPGVEKLGKHGLFSQRDEKIDLNETAKKIAEHDGFVYDHILSLKREDAERLGYNKAEAWKKMLRRNMVEIAQAHKIAPSDLEWYAAFHDTALHPHVHLIVISKSGQGYLSKNAIKELKKTFANDIFRDEQYKLFVDQTQMRDEIKDRANELINLIPEYPGDVLCTERFRELFPVLHDELMKLDGKKTYGYLPKPLKRMVDELLEEFIKCNDDVGELYHVWNEINREKLSLYYDSSKNQDIPISENKEFRSLKNALIQLALSTDTSQSSWTYYKNEYGGYFNIQMGLVNMFLDLVSVTGSAIVTNTSSKRRVKRTDKKIRQREKEKKIALGQHPDDNEDEGEDEGMSMSM